MKKPTITLLIAFTVLAVKAQEKQSPHFNADSTQFSWCEKCTIMQANPGYKIKLIGGVATTVQKEPVAQDTSKLIWARNAPIGIRTFKVYIDTIPVLTYCVNQKSLKVKWFKLTAIAGFNNPSMSMNGLIIYNKYLNVPKGYKAVFSISSK